MHDCSWLRQISSCESGGVGSETRRHVSNFSRSIARLSYGIEAFVERRRPSQQPTSCKFLSKEAIPLELDHI